MDHKLKEFCLHKHFGIEPIKKISKEIKIYQLVHLSGMRMVHGSYALCKSELNKQPHCFRKDYKIELYK